LLQNLASAIADEQGVSRGSQNPYVELRVSQDSLAAAFDAIERAKKANLIDDTTFERMQEDAGRAHRLDGDAVDAFNKHEKAKGKELVEKALKAKHRLVNALPSILLYEPEPKLKRIEAVFDSNTRSTVYTENATGENIDYHWAVAIPQDPPCAAGFHPHKPTSKQATWVHADTTEGGFCNHNIYDATGRGHPGTVVVIVQNHAWSCAATYFGTQGDNGRPAGEGDPPQRCHRRP
jgi:hypothetical protein